MSRHPIKVLVVDDSTFMRKTISTMLGSDPRMTVVGMARDGSEAIQLVGTLQPDVVTLDIEMPGMNGLEALKKIMEIRPLPVIMVSSLTEEGAKETLKALELGAVDYLPKQLEGVATNIVGIQQELIAKVIAAAGSAGKITRPNGSRPQPQPLALPKVSQSALNAMRGNKIDHLHAPSVDIMMQSVAEIYSGRGIGVILTGMGHDGLEGMKAIKGAKGRTVAQDEATCVVYGMPKAVVDGGYADKIVPLSHVAGEVMNMI
nr:response regulator [Nitrospirota bacterium]